MPSPAAPKPRKKTYREPKMVGKLRSDLPIDIFEVKQAAKLIAEKLIWVGKGEVKHRRESIRIPGLFHDHLDSAAHHLALATCQHLGSPCTFCLAWADLEVLSLALEKRKDDVLGHGTSRLIRTAGERIGKLAGNTRSKRKKSDSSNAKDVVDKGGRSSVVKTKRVAQGRATGQKNSKAGNKSKSAVGDSKRPRAGNKATKGTASRTKTSKRNAGKKHTASTKTNRTSK